MNSGTKKAGVIGWPVAHSLSPKLHGYWLNKYKINGEYKAYPVQPQELESFVKTMAEKGFSGCNLTLPHKEAVLGWLDETDPVARAIGAVNTIVVRSGKLHGSNTDAYGFTENIRPHLPARRNKAVVLGAGGAARAVVKSLLKLSFSSIIIANRTPDKTEALCMQFGSHIENGDWEKRAQLLANADLLVNTTSLGMTGKEPLDMDISALPRSALVTDIVYTPLETSLLKAARERGNPTVDGLGMLLHQAVPGFEAWFGVKPEVTPELRQTMISAL